VPPGTRPRTRSGPFELAIEEGADFIEFDVRAKDGELVVCHGPEPPDGVQRLDDVLGALAGRVGLCIELKEDVVAKPTLAALRAHRLAADELIVVSFLAGALDTVQHLWPRLRTELHLGPRPDAVAAARFWGAGFEEPAPADRIREAQSLGLAPLVFTVNEPERMRELSALGVSGLFTDRPALLRQTLHAHAGA
jgi:glycerophosphoryl diester phosphodiesterase